MSEREDFESVGGLHRLPLDISQTGTTELAAIFILKFAGVLAEDHDAYLIAVFIQPEPKVAAAETFALGVRTLAVIEAAAWCTPAPYSFAGGA